MCDPPSRFRKIPFDKRLARTSVQPGAHRSESSEKYLESHLSIEKIFLRASKKNLQCYTHYVKHTESSVKIVKNILRYGVVIKLDLLLCIKQTFLDFYQEMQPSLSPKPKIH